MSGAEQVDLEKWTFGVRYIRNQIKRAELRTTLTARLHPRLSLGVEYNPLEADVSPLMNWLAVGETNRYPALMLGTSSDRIGTPNGQSYYATASKNLRAWTGLPIAPYVGAAYGTYDDELRAIGGANLTLSERASALVIYDGVHVHPTLSWTQGPHVATFLLVEGKDPGISYSYSFDLPSRRE